MGHGRRTDGKNRTLVHATRPPSQAKPSLHKHDDRLAGSRLCRHSSSSSSVILVLHERCLTLGCALSLADSRVTHDLEEGGFAGRMSGAVALVFRTNMFLFGRMLRRIHRTRLPLENRWAALVDSVSHSPAGFGGLCAPRPAGTRRAHPKPDRVQVLCLGPSTQCPSTHRPSDTRDRFTTDLGVL